jgi:hypothetical protein
MMQIKQQTKAHLEIVFPGGQNSQIAGVATRWMSSSWPLCGSSPSSTQRFSAAASSWSMFIFLARRCDDLGMVQARIGIGIGIRLSFVPGRCDVIVEVVTKAKSMEYRHR